MTDFDEKAFVDSRGKLVEPEDDILTIVYLLGVEDGKKALKEKLDELHAERDKLRAMLTEAAPLVAEREFLENRGEYCYASSTASPGPAEWGIHVGYEQNENYLTPGHQFQQECDEFHALNREEHDPEVGQLSLYNQISDVLSAMTEMG